MGAIPSDDGSWLSLGPYRHRLLPSVCICTSLDRQKQIHSIIIILSQLQPLALIWYDDGHHRVQRTYRMGHDLSSLRLDRIWKLPPSARCVWRIYCSARVDMPVVYLVNCLG